MSGMGKLVSTTEAAKAVGVSQSTLSRWTSAGRVKPAQTTLGGHMRWDVEDLKRQIRRLLGEHGL